MHGFALRVPALVGECPSRFCVTHAWSVAHLAHGPFFRHCQLFAPPRPARATTASEGDHAPESLVFLLQLFPALRLFVTQSLAPFPNLDTSYGILRNRSSSVDSTLQLCWPDVLGLDGICMHYACRGFELWQLSTPTVSHIDPTTAACTKLTVALHGYCIDCLPELGWSFKA